MHGHWWAAGVLIGVAGQLQQARLWPPGSAAALTVLTGLLTLLLLWRSHGRGDRPRPGRWLGPALLLCGLGFGAAQADWRAAQRLAAALPAALEKVELSVVGRIASLPVQRQGGWRFHVEVESAQRLDDGRAVELPPRLALGWYAEPAQGDEVALLPAARMPRPGERWRLPLRLQRPHGNLNPHGFDFELWLFEQDLRATGTVRVRSNRPAERMSDAAGWRWRIEHWRLDLREALQRRLGPSAEAGVLAALLIGDQAAIERLDWELFRQTGVAHLMAISGLHVTMLAWLGAALIGRLWRVSPTLLQRWPAVQAGRCGGLLLALAYALLAGWGVPAQRTVLMLAIVTLLRSRARRWPWPRVLLAAALGVTLLDPWALLQPGFWLSFGAVGLLMLQGAEQALPLWPPTHWPALLRRGLRLQLLISIALAPLTLLLFGQISLVGLLANLVAIPWVTWLITPLALLGALIGPCWSLAAWLLTGLMQILTALADWPWASWQAAAAPWWLALPALLGALLLMAPLPRAARALGLLLMLPLLDPPLARPPQGQFELLGADVGQGNAVLIRTRHHTLLYDTGPSYGPGSDAGERVLVPLLRALGVARLDVLLLSHRDQDHVGGAAAVLRQIGAWRMLASLEPGHALRGRQISVPFQPCLAGQQWDWDGVRFELLHPRPQELERAAQGRLRPNGLSCVLRIEAMPTAGQARGRSVLLAGDIERHQELVLLETRAAQLQVDVLLMPHHGSRTSSTSEWLQQVRPSLALVQAGYLNRYGHPAPQVLERYRMHSIGVVRTDVCGAWHWNSADAARWCERAQSRRYWHSGPQPDGPEFAKDPSFIDQPP
ncbi:MAG: hypothetical protein RJA44_301 [Pseudomonadota bacterium]